ncbi:MAG: hypothetical protein ACJAV9_001533, partial [Urechidicola sp.]
CAHYGFSGLLLLIGTILARIVYKYLSPED